MGNKLVGKGIMALAEILGDIIRKGKPIPTVAGFLIGCVLGGLIAFYSIYLLVPALGVGAIAGPVIAAALFPKPPRVRGEGEDGELPGPVIRYWLMQWPGVNGLYGAALMERAIYSVFNIRTSWEYVLSQLEKGIAPGLPEDKMIPISGIVRLEISRTKPSSQFHGVEIVYVKGRLQRREINFSNGADRDDFVASVEDLAGPFVSADEPMDSGRAIRLPLFLTAATLAVFAAIAVLSAHWTVHPPLPPKGQQQQDDLVRFLIWAGPQRILLAGLLVAVGFLGWLFKRLMRPPILQVNRPVEVIGNVESNVLHDQS